MTGRSDDQPGASAACSKCGKLRYLTRKAARRQAQRLYPGDRLSAYPCGEFWHIGHLPDFVKSGAKTRKVLPPWRKGAT